MKSVRRHWQRVLPAAAIVALGASSVIGIRSAYRSRRVEERTLRDYATLAALSFSGRAYSMVANTALPVIVAAGKRGERTPAADLEQVAAVADSLRSCCPVALPARGVASGLWGDSTSVRLRSSPRLTPADSAERIALLRRVTAWDSIGGAIARFAPGGTSASPLLYVVYPQYNRAREDVGFVAIDVDVAAASRSMFGAILRQAPLLLPRSMTGLEVNDSIGSIAIASGAGVEIFRTVAPTTQYDATVALGRRGDLAVTLSLSPAAVRGLMRGSTPGQGAGMQVALSLLALALAIVIVSAFYSAQRLSRLRSEFAASVTHELRTPLTQILLNAETLALKRERSSDERGAFLQAIVRESRRLVRLVDNVLHFSRAERRLLRVQPRRERIDALVETAVRERAQLAEPGSPPIQHVAPDPVWATVDADALMLVLANLLDNAVRHGGGTPVRITTIAASNGAAAEIHVDDEGPGIAARDRRRAFEPFVRLAGAHERHPTGSGIGLAVVAEIVEAMHGSVKLESAGARGLRVRIKLAPSNGAAGTAS